MEKSTFKAHIDFRGSVPLKVINHPNKVGSSLNYTSCFACHQADLATFNLFHPSHKTFQKYRWLFEVLSVKSKLQVVVSRQRWHHCYKAALGSFHQRQASRSNVMICNMYFLCNHSFSSFWGWACFDHRRNQGCAWFKSTRLYNLNWSSIKCCDSCCSF